METDEDVAARNALQTELRGKRTMVEELRRHRVEIGLRVFKLAKVKQ